MPDPTPTPPTPAATPSTFGIPGHVGTIANASAMAVLCWFLWHLVTVDLPTERAHCREDIRDAIRSQESTAHGIAEMRDSVRKLTEEIAENTLEVKRLRFKLHPPAGPIPSTTPGKD